MAIPTRKLVRDAMRTRLADDATGFNAVFASTAAAYGIDAFTIDFAPGSESFGQMYLHPEGERLSELVRDPATMVLYTTLTGTLDASQQAHGSIYEGRVTGNLDVYLRLADRSHMYDAESLCDAVEDALTEVLNKRTGWPAGLLYTRDLSCGRDPIAWIADGYYEQRIALRQTFEVHV